MSNRKEWDSYIPHVHAHVYPNASANPVPSLPAGFGANIQLFDLTD